MSSVVDVFKMLFNRRKRRAKRIAAEALAKKPREPISCNLGGHRQVMGIEGDWQQAQRTPEQQQRYDQLLARNQQLREKNAELLARNALLLDMLCLTEMDSTYFIKQIQEKTTKQQKLQKQKLMVQGD